eukprot:INCI220.1.p1 GENE.INCI220.1~~INCI220.1.p1  ORF type:complete len:402 (+),score=44.55 INCI220.1:78-1283(+)
MGNDVSSNLPEVQYQWTLRAKNFFRDTVPIVSGDGSTLAVYSRGEKKIHVLDARTGVLTASIPLKQKELLGNVSAIPSLSYDGSKIVTRDGHSVLCFNRAGQLMWEYERTDKKVRSGMQSWIAQISTNGKVAVVRMFHHLILLNGDNASVIANFHHKHQMASSIPRISDDGSTVINVDGRTIMAYVDREEVWSNESPERTRVLYNGHFGDPAISGNGSACGAIAGDIAYIYDARTGQQLGAIPEVRSWKHENSCELSFSYDGRVVAVARHKRGVAVYTGPSYSTLLLEYFHDTGVHRPVAPLLTRDGKTLASKCGDSILIWQIGGPHVNMPTAVARVQDASDIPGGPTVHNQYVHHDRDTHHKRTFSCSHDGSVCVAVAKSRALWAFRLTADVPQGGAIKM